MQGDNPTASTRYDLNALAQSAALTRLARLANHPEVYKVIIYQQLGTFYVSAQFKAHQVGRQAVPGRLLTENGSTLVQAIRNLYDLVDALDNEQNAKRGS